MKKTICIFFAVIMLFALLASGCAVPAPTETKSPEKSEAASVEPSVAASESAQPSEPAKKRTIIWANPLIGHPVYVIQEQGFRKAAEDLGFEPVIVGNSAVDPEAYAKEIENAIVQQPDGIIACAYNWSAFEAVYKKAKEKNIPIVNTNADTPKEWRLAYIGTVPQNFGKIAAEQLIKKKNGKANVCIMTTALDVQQNMDIIDAFKKAIEGYPNMKISVIEADNADRVIAMQKFQEIFQAYPEVDSVVDLEATGPNAAAQVVKEMKLQDKMTIIGIDDIDETLENVRNGLIWGTLAQNFYVQGYVSAKLIMDHHAGKEIVDNNDSGLVFITKENIDTYKTDFEKTLDQFK